MWTLDRSSPTSGRFLDLKVTLFTLGAGLALGGMYLDVGWLIWVAMMVLLAGLMVRWFGQRMLPQEAATQEDDEDHTTPSSSPPTTSEEASLGDRPSG